MIKHKENYWQSCPGTWEEYSANASKPGNYAGRSEMSAICKKFKVNMLIHQRGPKDDPVILTIKHKPLGEIPTIHLSYHPEQHHFNSIRTKEDPGKKAAIKCPVGHFWQHFTLGQTGKEAEDLHKQYEE